MLKDWQDRAAKGDAEFVDKLLSRPSLTNDEARYMAAFVYLNRDRSHDSLSLGMAGGITLPRPVPRAAIREEGVRLGYEGEALEDFVLIVVGIDDTFVEIQTKRAAADAKKAAEAAANKPRR